MVRRRREFGRRKWSMDEMDKILDFIRRNPFEEPNGADYYRKMAESLGRDKRYKSVRSKVHYMLMGYKKARSMLALRPDTAMSELLLICPYYTQFNEVFKNNKKARRNTVCARPRRPSTPSTLAQFNMEASDLDISDYSAASNPGRAKLSTSTVALAQATNSFPQPIIFKQESICPNQPTRLHFNDSITIPNILSVESLSPRVVENENNDINADSSTAPTSTAPTSTAPSSTTPTSTETEQPQQQSTVAEPEAINSQLNTMPMEDLKLMELRLHEKELELRLFKIQSKERLMRLQLESKERIKMKKLSLKYGQNQT